ncbi:hypothetical protein GK047_17270 [Paenibacillus sp. SYP-B3998]|uniref:DUF2269 family protein n=1 Tax=Paenibacillus sp. SYP-B3998 TaxID=2678564 RepID=A0A6G4A1E0_9BACL|nr:hypothetical protein [Paenibacillus sp. SYP-B3998]NEW07754.1 hypothetical protein [Paenibacillus sp. SYP-B3998]
MYSVMIFLHVVSALFLGCYVLFPFLTGRAATLSGAAQESFVGLLRSFNRVGQYAAIVAFITGGALISKTKPSVLWMILAIVLLLIIVALSGMMGGRMKKLIVAAKAGKDTASDVAKIKTFSWIAAIAVIVAVLIMTNPQLLA